MATSGQLLTVEYVRTREARLKWGLLGLFLLAMLTRLLWWHIGPQVIENEGVYYARVGENLAAGRGLVGIHEMGLQLNYPPLYSSLIAIGVLLGLAAETAGRAVSILLGAGLPVVACIYGRRYFGAAAGWLAGMIATLHPLLIVVSTAVLTESAYMTIALLALYFVVDVNNPASRRPAILAGVFLGLGYLLRPEAFILTFLLAFVSLLAGWRQWRLALQRSGLLLAVFAIFAVPYIAFLSLQTGQIRFEAKTADGLRYALRLEAKQSWGEIYFSVDQNLRETGASNTSDLEMLQTTHASTVHRFRILARQARQNFSRLLRGLSDLQMGSPFLLMLAALGLFSLPWDRARLSSQTPLVTAAALTLVTFCTWPFFHDRFLYPLLPVLLIWAGVGLERTGAWTRGTLNAHGITAPRVTRMVAACAYVMPIMLVCAAGASGVRYSDELSQSWNDARLRDSMQVGRWLRSVQTSPQRLMDTGPTVAFYSGDVLVPFPWTDGVTALRYIQHKRISLLVLRDADRENRPYLAEWLRNVPSERFDLIKEFPGEAGMIRVYRWRE